MSEFCKDAIKDEAPKSCLIAHRYYTTDFYESFDEAKRSMYYVSPAEITKDDILKEQTNDVERGYKFAVTDTLLNFGRLDEDMNAVFPIHLFKHTGKIKAALSSSMNMVNTDENFLIPQKFEGILFSTPSLAPSM